MTDNFSQSFLARFSLYPRDNKEQAVRIRRFFMAAGTYAVAFILGFIQISLVTYGLVIYLLVTFKPSSIVLKVELLQAKAAGRNGVQLG